jgi:hypothetical protein
VLKVHQLISQTTKRLCIPTVPFFSQILADQIEHGGEGAETVVFLNMKLQACFVHTRSMLRVSVALSFRLSLAGRLILAIRVETSELR